MAPTTYILPDLPCAVLLEPVLQQAQPGPTIVVYTAAMRAHGLLDVRDAGRTDLVVRQRKATPAVGWSEAS